VQSADIPRQRVLHLNVGRERQLRHRGQGVKSYYSCRIKKGKTGRCTSKVRGYSWRETRQAIPTELNARVTCKQGKRSVVHTSQQNL
jgi:hypothetical protein